MTKTGNTLRKIRAWWYLHRPRITTRAKNDAEIWEIALELDIAQKREMLKQIKSVIFSLKELRNNTWDVERVDKIANCLGDIFKYEERL